MFTEASLWRVAIPFFKNPTKEYSIAELERETKLTYPALRAQLERLAKQHIIAWQSEAKPKKEFKLYKAEREHSEFRYWKRVYNQLSLRALVQHLQLDFQPEVIVLFGSYGRGEDDDDSDIDLYLQAVKKRENLIEFEKALGKDIQLVIANALEDLPDSLQLNIRSGAVLSGTFTTMVRRPREPNTVGASHLRTNARQDHGELKLLSPLKSPALFTRLSYDILRMYAEAYAVQKGVRFFGDGAHYELIEFLREENILTERERDFFQQLREKRNENLYEGIPIPKEFAAALPERLPALFEKVAEAQPPKPF